MAKVLPNDLRMFLREGRLGCLSLKNILKLLRVLHSDSTEFDVTAACAQVKFHILEAVPYITLWIG